MGKKAHRVSSTVVTLFSYFIQIANITILYGVKLKFYALTFEK